MRWLFRTLFVVVGFVIVGFIVIIVIAVFLDDPQESAESDAEVAASDQARSLRSEWSMIHFVNEFGERTDQGAMSREVSPRRPMAFPYGDVTARIIVDCDRAWVRFNDSPNLTGGDIGDGYEQHAVVVRVDGEESRWPVRQTWGHDDINFVGASQAIAAFSGGANFDLAVPWYGEGSVAFSWSLAGAADAIQQSCD